MDTYKCNKCGMSVNATCGKCNAPLINDLLKLDDGREVNEDLIDKLIAEELDKTRKRVGNEVFKKVPFENAAKIFRDMITAKNFDDFLTLSLYEKI